MFLSKPLVKGMRQSGPKPLEVAVPGESGDFQTHLVWGTDCPMNMQGDLC